MSSQKKPAPATTQVSRVPQRTCMKNSTTSSAFVTAIVSMTTLFSAPEVELRHDDGEDRADHQGPKIAR